MNFTELNLHPDLLAAVASQGYSVPTAIQKQAIPHLLQGRDLLGLAQTGTGKTAAFVLPTLQLLRKGPRRKTRALVLTPTRELAEQISDNVDQLSRGSKLHCCSIYGGVSKPAQEKKLERGAEIVVACPGRLLDHINSRTIDLSGVEILILDEADQMLDQGFLPDVRRIIKNIPRRRQTMVFSATMPEAIRKFTDDILVDPVGVQAEFKKPPVTISHALYPVSQSRKTALLKDLLRQEEMTSTLVFTRTKHRAKNLARQLENAGFSATSLQGNLSQNRRKIAMDGFRSGKYSILIATDIAARGIDVQGISHVINYDMPDTAEAYTHRTGRTGRAERTGQAYSFTTSEDRKLISMVEASLGRKLPREKVAEFDYGNSSGGQEPLERGATGRPVRNGRRAASGWKKKRPARGQVA